MALAKAETSMNRDTVPRDLVVVGASAGGVDELRQLAAGLPSSIPAAILVLLHLPQNAISALPEILDRAGPLPAITAIDGSAIEHGHIYVAPPNYHLLVDPERLRVVLGPRENRHRPAIDVLFRSAACAYKERVVGVILSGTLDDGTLGMASIKSHGGVAIVQDPDEAPFPGMPTSAVRSVDVDYCVSISEIPQLLNHLATAASKPVEIVHAAPVISEKDEQRL